MNEDYLWDKTGEADPDIELLERKLSSLRFKRPAEPLPLPAVAPRRLFWHSFPRPALAAAAALVVLLLAGGLWLGLTERGAAPAPSLAESGPRPPIGPEPTPNAVDPLAGQATVADSLQEETVEPKRKQRRSPMGMRQVVARRSAPRRASAAREELARRGEEAKAQLIKALHIASDKLNEVQKKIQGAQERGPIS